ncbi:MAG TPA: hypothetical protein VGX50_00520, partial [Longimicrobium sp.]|nr:hypothetical protein [Longimicrobium sp.]
MQITLTIPDPLIPELSREAEALGLTLSDHIVRLLRQRNASIVPLRGPLTGEELVEYWTREG